MSRRADSNYRRKYERLKRRINALVFENAALCDEVARVQEETMLAKEEREYLFARLLRLEGDEPARRDKVGRIEFPIRLGDLTVHSLGRIVVDKPLYHTEDALFPIGFSSTRLYGSVRDPTRKCAYSCKIVEGNNEPRFEISAESDTDSPIVGSSPDYCHAILLQYMYDAVNTTNFSTYPKGGKFFGLTHPKIVSLIESLPGAKSCKNYERGRYRNTNRDDDDDEEENDPTLNFDRLQKCVLPPYRSIGEIKEEPPDDIDFDDHR